MDEVVRSDSDTASHVSPDGVPGYGSLPAPWCFAGRYVPRELAGYWMDVVALSANRTGVLLGCCRVDDEAGGFRAVARAELLRSADPVQSLNVVSDAPVSAICAVIDGDTMSFSAHGDAGAAIGLPGGKTTVLGSITGLVVSPLAPGATVLMSTQSIGGAAILLDDCSGVHPETLADRAILSLDGADGTAALLYRHPPAPLDVTMPADKAFLAASRGLLRDWLASAGVDTESSADVLLAVGEATANATEHAVAGASERVDVTLKAAVDDRGLRLSVSDNGCWRPAATSPGHRGHGLHLMNALLDTVELRTGPQGTTVTMFKELSR